MNLLNTPVILNLNCIGEKQYFCGKMQCLLISKVVLYGLLPLCIQAYLTDDELSYLGSKVKRKNLNLEKRRETNRVPREGDAKRRILLFFLGLESISY